MPVQIASVVFTSNPKAVIEIDEGFQSLLVVQVDSPEVLSAPSSLVASVFETFGEDDLIFTIDGHEVLRQESDPDGAVEFVSVPVPDLRDANKNHIMQPGTHLLEVTQGSGIGAIEFNVVDPPQAVPEEVSPDAPPAYIPGAIQPDGTRRWVFQDLMPDGIGSWVMFMNPQEMDTPPFMRELTAEPTTASEELGGQFHIWENEWSPVEWTFRGYCPSKEMREKLEAYDSLERRWYLHDHRGRAWKVVAQHLDLTPRLTQIWNGEYTDEGHDYAFTVMVTEREWTDV